MVRGGLPSEMAKIERDVQRVVSEGIVTFLLLCSTLPGRLVNHERADVSDVFWKTIQRPNNALITHE
jgi:hypothetical protein